MSRKQFAIEAALILIGLPAVLFSLALLGYALGY